MNDTNKNELLPHPQAYITQELAVAAEYDAGQIAATGGASATVAGVVVDLSVRGDAERYDGCGRFAEYRLPDRHMLAAESHWRDTTPSSGGESWVSAGQVAAFSVRCSLGPCACLKFKLPCCHCCAVLCDAAGHPHVVRPGVPEGDCTCWVLWSRVHDRSTSAIDP